MKLADVKPEKLAHPMARAVIASYFLAKSVGLVFDPNSFDAVFAATPIPEYFRWPEMMFQFAAAGFILVGFQTRLAASLLGIHLFWSSFIFNYVPGDAVAISAFWKDIALIGGLLLLVGHGRGPFALDSWLAARDIARRRAENRATIGETPTDSQTQTA